MPWVAVGLIAAGAAVNVMGQMKENEGKDAAYDVNRYGIASKLREFNINAERFEGKQIATFAKSGVDMTGSPLDVMADQAYSDEMTRQNIKYQGEVLKYTHDLEQSSRNLGFASTILGAATKAVGVFGGGLGPKVGA